MNKNNDLIELTTRMKRTYYDYDNLSKQLVDMLNTKFNTDIVEDIIWQPSDGFCILWKESNTYLDTEAISKLNTKEQFEQYLDDNTIS